MSNLQNIPAIIVLPRSDSDLAAILEAFHGSGVQPRYIIHTFPLTSEFKTYFRLSYLQCSSNELSKTMAETIRTLTEADSSFEQLILFENEGRISSPDILAGTYISVLDPDSFINIETNDVLRVERSLRLLLIKSIVGSNVDEPNPFFWVIPRKACELLCQSAETPKYFPLSWLRKCNEHNIPIRNLTLSSNDETTFHRSPYGAFRILMFSLDLFFRYAASGLISMLADNLVFFFLAWMHTANLPALVISRIVSTLINYSLLRYAVFREGTKSGNSFLRYISLVIFSTSVVWLCLEVLSKNYPHNPVTIKMLIEAVMFFFNYLASKSFVFKHKNPDAE